MSATNSPVSLNKEKKPSLSAKHSKFLVFGYWFTQQLLDKQLLSDSQSALELLTLFSDVSAQTTYFQTFLDELKSSTKDMKSSLKAHNKPPPKSKAKPAKSDNAESKRGRKKKDVVVVHDKQDELVAELVAAANEQTILEPVLKRKYNRKPKNAEPVESTVEATVETPAQILINSDLDNYVLQCTIADMRRAATVEAPVEAPVETKKKASKEKKEKAPKEKKEKAPKKSKTVQQPILEEEEEEIETKPITIGDAQYLIDSDLNIYDIKSHENIGTFDSTNNIIIPL
jgi:hypothetical protein